MKSLICLLFVTLVTCSLVKAHSVFLKEEVIKIKEVYTEIDDNDNGDDEFTLVRNDAAEGVFVQSEEQKIMAIPRIFLNPKAVRSKSFSDIDKCDRVMCSRTCRYGGHCLDDDRCECTLKEMQAIDQDDFCNKDKDCAKICNGLKYMCSENHCICF